MESPSGLGAAPETVLKAMNNIAAPKRAIALDHLATDVLDRGRIRSFLGVSPANDREHAGQQRQGTRGGAGVNFWCRNDGIIRGYRGPYHPDHQ